MTVLFAETIIAFFNANLIVEINKIKECLSVTGSLLNLIQTRLNWDKIERKH